MSWLGTVKGFLSTTASVAEESEAGNVNSNDTVNAFQDGVPRDKDAEDRFMAEVINRSGHGNQKLYAIIGVSVLVIILMKKRKR